MSRTTILDTHRLFCDSGRIRFYHTHAISTNTVALGGAYSADVGIRAEHADGAHHEIIAAAATALVISGIIPLAVWAFFRFNAKRAVDR